MRLHLEEIINKRFSSFMRIYKNSGSSATEITRVCACAVESRGVALSDISGRTVDTN